MTERGDVGLLDSIKLTAAVALAVVWLGNPSQGAVDSDLYDSATPPGVGDSESAHARRDAREHVIAKRITDTSDLLGGPRAEGQTGDFLLQNSHVSVIVEEPGHPHGYGVSGGNVVDAGSAPDWVDEFELMLSMMEEFPRQARYDTVYVESDGSEGVATIVARGVDAWNADVRITTRYTLEPSHHFITLKTTVENQGEALSDYDVGDIIQWGDSRHFAPGYGFDIDWITVTTQWLGGVGTDICYGYTTTEGSLVADNGSLWSDPFVTSADLAPGDSLSYVRHFVVGRHDLASVTDVIHEIRDIRVGTVAGRILDAATSEPVAGATIECFVHGGTPYTIARSDSGGSYHATLHPLSHMLACSHPEYISQEKTVSISGAGTTPVDFLLESPSSGVPIGDTLTVVMRPIMSVPQIVTPGDDINIEAIAPQGTSSWRAWLVRGTSVHEISVTEAAYSQDHERWFIRARVPTNVPHELYSLTLTASGGISDRVDNAVMVSGEPDDGFYFVHITDTHLPTHLFFGEPGAQADTSEMEDLRAIIEDVNLINPAFVIVTGDLINEGELEDFLEHRNFTKTQRLLGEFEVPVYITAGNHDVGGWDSTPPPDGTARRNWWRFFGWPYLESPPPLDDLRTQNYSFNHGSAHFVGLEAYINYDSWRYELYGSTSFTPGQIAWLASDLTAAGPGSAKILFYHYDFQSELDLEALGVDLALWGHIHQSSGTITSPPFDLSTGPVCDGHRIMRLIRVIGNTVVPSEPVSSGQAGQALTLTFDPDNDGNSPTVTATITNNMPESFERALVKFRVPSDFPGYEVDGGTILQHLDEWGSSTYYVEVDVPEASVVTVTIDSTGQSQSGSGPGPLALLPNYPNPARTGTAIGFVLASHGNVRLEVLSVSGRRVATLHDGPIDAGEHELPWDLRDGDGRMVASGVYVCRLEAEGRAVNRKMVVLK